MTVPQPEEFDYIVIGSGFGGSVSAMRLVQKGYKVAVIEAGKKWAPGEFSETNWNLKKFLWMPALFLKGIQRISLLRNVMILGGAGVGGGSLNYANTHYIPPDTFFKNPTVLRLENKHQWFKYYELAKKMLGTTTNPALGTVDTLLQDTAEEFNKKETFRPTDVGVYFGQKAVKQKDPYFEGEGPDRIGCELCGACMTGCNKDAKNTLDKNYLYFAEKWGASIYSEMSVTSVVPLSSDGSEGYQVKTLNSQGAFTKKREFKAKGVIFSAGVLGTLSLLMKMKDKNILPNLSDQLGKKVRTNSEALIGVRAKSSNEDYSTGVAITSSVYPDEVTHIEPVRYAKGNDAMGLLSVLLTDGGGRVPRPLKYFINVLKQPFDFLKVLNPFGFARSGMILLVMQTQDNHININRKIRLLWPFKKTLNSYQPNDNPNPVYIPIANEFARKMATKMNGIACSSLPEVYFNIPLTAHIMGGCSVGEKEGEGVIDEQNNLRGYQNLLVVDGSTIPANLGVNPSLSIAAFAERAMSFIPPKDGHRFHHLKVEETWRVKELVNPHS